MASCGNFNEETFMESLNEINDLITKGDLIKNLKSLADEPCSISIEQSGGKKSKSSSKSKRSKKYSRSKKGGRIPVKNIVKTFLYVLVAALIGLGMNSPNMQTVKDGLLMIYNGECNTIQNRIWSWIGIENPVCALYNNLLFKLIPNALIGNAEALTKLVGMFSIGFGGPVMVIRQIDNIGSLIENEVNRTLQIENQSNTSVSVNEENMIENGTNMIEDQFSNEFTHRGGKMSRRKKTLKKRHYRK
jgi:hypothetical protein